jgi:hypothetical protein
VFGYGTFGLAVCFLSAKVEVVYCFKGFGEGDYEDIPSVLKVVKVLDRAGRYMKPGEWRNQPEQLQLMIDYPESYLVMTN